VYDPAAGRVLLRRSSTAAGLTGGWSLFCGEPAERDGGQPAATWRRAIGEAIGLALDDGQVRRLASYPDPLTGAARHVFYAELAGPVDRLAPGAGERVGWLGLDEALRQPDLPAVAKGDLLRLAARLGAPIRPPDPLVDELIDALLAGTRAALGDRLIGLYLGGSLVIGDFDPEISDLDLIAAVASDPDEREYEALRAMHAELAARWPAWSNRVEVRYVPRSALAAARSGTGQIVSISPGEPFHRRALSVEWLLDWYLLRERSVTLFGPHPRQLVEPIGREDLAPIVAILARSWGAWVRDMRSRKGQAYAVTCLCRALYTDRHGDQVSKLQAARWARRELPDWAGLIDRAVGWRAAPADEPGDETYEETARFVEEVRALILRG
jgi:hypothetical protein